MPSVFAPDGGKLTSDSFHIQPANDKNAASPRRGFSVMAKSHGTVGWSTHCLDKKQIITLPQRRTGWMRQYRH